MALRILVLGGCGFLGSHVVDLLVGYGRDVYVLDDLSTCRIDPRDENRAFYLNPGAHYGLRPDSLDALVVLSLRHPVERERPVYTAAFEGYVVQTMRLFSDYANSRRKLRLVVGSVLETVASGSRHEPHVHLTRALRELLVYWHRPPNVGTYFVHLPELRGVRRETPMPDGWSRDLTASVERAAELIVYAATSMPDRLRPDLYLEDLDVR